MDPARERANRRHGTTTPAAEQMSDEERSRRVREFLDADRMTDEERLRRLDEFLATQQVSPERERANRRHGVTQRDE